MQSASSFAELALPSLASYPRLLVPSSAILLGTKEAGSGLDIDSKITTVVAVQPNRS